MIISPKIAIITIPGHENVGNTLQTFALQSKIKEILPKADPIVINQKDTKHLLNFYKKNVKYSTSGFDSSYDGIVVGSDQIWHYDINKYWKLTNIDKFALYKNVKKIFYAPSFGTINQKYSNNTIIKIANELKNEKFISNRELFGSYMAEKMFNIKSETVLDPTMLYNSDFYLKSINEVASNNKKGIFTYILDNNKEIKKSINEIANKINEDILPFDGSVEQFIKNMNDAKCIITDSYHGTVFSLIFNKPFICLKNKKRGNMRFDDLNIRFDLKNRFYENLNNIDINLLYLNPNVNNLIEKEKIKSLNFLIRGLYQLKE